MTDEKKIRKLRKQLDKATQKDRLEDAVKALAGLEKEDPKSPRWPHRRGDCYRKLGKRKKAIQCYAMAVDLYADQGFLARAIAMAKTVLNLDPSRIDVLERVDPDSARALHRQQRPDATSGFPEKGEAAAAAPQHPMLLDDGVPGAGGGHPMILDDAAPAPTGGHAMIIEDGSAVAGGGAHPMVIDDQAADPPAPQRHPMILDDEPEAQEAPPARRKKKATRKRKPRPVVEGEEGETPAAAARTGRVIRTRPTTRRNITLNELSLPPPAQKRAAGPMAPSDAVAMPAAPRVPDLGGVPDVYDAVEVEELVIDPGAQPNETRFSNAPPAMTVGVEVSADELAERDLASTGESPRPDPPSAQKLSRLPLLPLFAEVPKAALGEMVTSSELVELGDGAIVVRHGDASDALYGIVEGSVQVVVPGQSVRLTLAEGDVFGESCLIPGEKRHADVVVVGRMTALRIPREVLATLLASHRRLAEVLLELLTRRLLGNLLQTSPLFAEFDATGRRELAQLFEIRRAPKGTYLAEVGKMMDGLYINLTGDLSVTGQGGTQHTVGPGNMFGQSTLLANEASNVSVKALSNMVVLRLTNEAFTQVAMQYPAILASISEIGQSEVAKVST